MYRFCEHRSGQTERLIFWSKTFNDDWKLKNLSFKIVILELFAADSSLSRLTGRIGTPNEEGLSFNERILANETRQQRPGINSWKFILDLHLIALSTSTNSTMATRSGFSLQVTIRTEVIGPN
ncbi:hypothetical protein OGAPHI_005282 [Ogataea philodendri]|uniref:Uncharacterized protein n=1 Tax=Ogataea philodendri TaxID=1378263 RepID=A0A9P8P2I3_9ASCO|nr:uncharacterized protein OGAPHI_005282 [Ogataea philodendri]KAH3663879.1 hypothetical protein OGAPHI_005282 [Ogataea philodendri]